MNSVKLVATLPDGRVWESESFTNTQDNYSYLKKLVEEALQSDFFAFRGKDRYYAIPHGLLPNTTLEVVEFDAEA